MFDVGGREVFVQLDDGGLPERLHELEVDLRRKDETLRLRRHAHQPGLEGLLDLLAPLLLQTKRAVLRLVHVQKNHGVGRTRNLVHQILKLVGRKAGAAGEYERRQSYKHAKANCDAVR